MIDGPYLIMLRTPMGVKNGELTLRTANGILSGKMCLMGNENFIGQGTADGNKIRFSGEMKTAVGQLAYDCTGNIDGDTLNGVVRTNKGDFVLNGKRK